MKRFITSPILRNYFDDAALKMATFKPRVEVIGLDIRVGDRREFVYVTGESDGLMHLVDIHEHMEQFGVNKFFPKNRVIINAADAIRLKNDATHGRYMVCRRDDEDGESIFDIYYLPDSLIDEACHLITSDVNAVIIATRMPANERNECVTEIESIEQLKAILKEY